MRSKILALLLSCSLVSSAQLPVIPAPVVTESYNSATSFNGSVFLSDTRKINTSALFTNLNDYLLSRGLPKLQRGITKDKQAVQVIINEQRFDGKPGDYYEMEVKKNMVAIKGTGAGLFYGIQSFKQLITKDDQDNWRLLEGKIVDYPRFSYRGMHFDVARHFSSVAFVKKYIDYLAEHKMNVFHWHLTDDQGWRIEIKKYPKLTTIGGWRNGTIIGRYPGTGNTAQRYGGFYTQDEIREVVKYATERYVTVIPEIEMPGHASAAIAAYPELSCFPERPTPYPKECTWSGPRTGKEVQQTWGVFDDVFCAGKENTFHFLQDVLDEIIPLFPSKYIHVGGDECPKTYWKECASCQLRMKENNIKDEHELQSYFIRRMESYLNKKGKTLIGWDEILEGGLAPNAVVMSWRGEAGGIEAAKQSHDVIMTPGSPLYFDHTQSENEDSVTFGGYNPVEKVYAYEPLPKELDERQSKYILGAQANLWTEYITNPKKVEYMLFPRLDALSEIDWSPKAARDWSSFQKRLAYRFKEYDERGINYSHAFYELKSKIESESGVLNWKILGLDATDKVLYVAAPRIVLNADTIPLYDVNDAGKIIGWQIHEAGDTVFRQELVTFSGEMKIPVELPGLYEVKLYRLRQKDMHTVRDPQALSSVRQVFQFNKATGKKIELKSDPAKSYPGDGAVTLVNGICNEKGFARSKEFIGYSGDDCEMLVDLGSSQTINTISIHALKRRTSWIWEPASASVWISNDNINFTRAGDTAEFIIVNPTTGNGMMKISIKPVTARYVKLLVKNQGIIPAGEAGAGKKAWLFLDEVSID